MKKIRIIKEDYLDNVPDMAGLSPIDPKGEYREFIMIKVPGKRGEGDRWMKLPFQAWETPKNHLRSAHDYYMIRLDDGEEVYVKAPTTFDKTRLLDKIEKFLTDEYGHVGSWDVVGKISPETAKSKSTWDHN